MKNQFNICEVTIAISTSPLFIQKLKLMLGDSMSWEMFKNFQIILVKIALFFINRDRSKVRMIN